MSLESKTFRKTGIIDLKEGIDGLGRNLKKDTPDFTIEEINIHKDRGVTLGVIFINVQGSQTETNHAFINIPWSSINAPTKSDILGLRSKAETYILNNVTALVGAAEV